MCIPKTSSLDVHALRCPCCKLNNLPKCIHPRATCPTQANHPRFQVVYFKTDLQTFSGCGYCKFARRYPFTSDCEAAQRNHGWPGCCRSPRSDDLPDLDILTDWPAIAAYHAIPLPKPIADALSKAGHSLTHTTRHSPTATRSATVRLGGLVVANSGPGPSRDTHRTETDHIRDATKDRDHHSNPLTGTGRVSPHRRINALSARAASPTSPSNTHDQPNNRSPTSPRSTTSSGSGSSHSSNSLSASSRKVDRSTTRERDRDRDRDRDPDSTMTSTRQSQDSSPKGLPGPNVNIRESIREKHASWSASREKGATTTPQKERRSDEWNREYERGKDHHYSVGRKPQPQQIHPIATISKGTAPQAPPKHSRPSLPPFQKQELYTKPTQPMAASLPPTASLRKLASVADATYQRNPVPPVQPTRTTRTQAPSLTAMMATVSLDNAAYSAYPSRVPVDNSRLPPPELLVPRPPNPSPPASRISSNSSNSSTQDGTVISDGAFTDYLSDDSDVELSRQAEERAERQYQEALIRAEEQEFHAAREILLSVSMGTSPDGPTSRPTVDEKRYYAHSHAALPQVPQGYPIAAVGYTRR